MNGSAKAHGAMVMVVGPLKISPYITPIENCR